MAKKPDTPRKIPVNKKLLTAEEKTALLKQARESIVEEMTQDARDAYFAEALASVRRENVPQEAIVHIAMDLAPYLQNVMIDGVQYFHGYGYNVEASKASVLYEQMQRSWMHQDEIDGRSRSEAYRRPQNNRLGPQHAGMAVRGFNGRPIIAEI